MRPHYCSFTIWFSLGKYSRCCTPYSCRQNQCMSRSHYVSFETAILLFLIPLSIIRSHFCSIQYHKYGGIPRGDMVKPSARVAERQDKKFSQDFEVIVRSWLLVLCCAWAHYSFIIKCGIIYLFRHSKGLKQHLVETIECSQMLKFHDQSAHITCVSYMSGLVSQYITTSH